MECDSTQKLHGILLLPQLNITNFISPKSSTITITQSQSQSKNVNKSIKLTQTHHHNHTHIHNTLLFLNRIVHTGKLLRFGDERRRCRRKLGNNDEPPVTGGESGGDDERKRIQEGEIVRSREKNNGSINWIRN